MIAHGGQKSRCDSSGVIEGDHARITGVRNFEYQSRNDFTVRYEERELQLSHLTGLDFYVSYWSKGPVARTFVSFIFDNASPLQEWEVLWQGKSDMSGTKQPADLSIFMDGWPTIFWTSSGGASGAIRWNSRCYDCDIF